MSINICKICSIKFYVKPYHELAGFGKYCSRACHHKGMQEGKVLNCFMCNKEIYRSTAKLKNSKSEKYFCGKSCQTKWRNTQYTRENHKNWKDGEGIDYRSIMINSNNPEICTLCNIEDKRILAVHHIDEDRKNNKLDNLMWLCHNCHHTVHYDKVYKQSFKEKIKY